MVTLKEVARLAGVSVTTASYALNERNADKLRAETRNRVITAARTLGYHPNLVGRLIQGGYSKLIGIMECQRSVNVYSELTHLLAINLYAQGYKTVYRMIHTIPDDTRVEEDAVNELLASQVDGIIYTCFNDVKRYPRESCPVPTVVFNSAEPDVTVDLEAGGYLAAHHLIQHGHQRIGYLGSFASENTQKVQGYRRALTEAGISPAPEWLANILEVPSWQSEIDRLVDDAGVTAICCGNDEYAANLERYLLTRGLRIPEDIAVMGFDGLSYVDWLPAPLSTVVQPVEAVAQALSSTMVEKIRQHDRGIASPIRCLQPKLHLRNSCGCQVSRTSGINWNHLYTYIQ